MTKNTLKLPLMIGLVLTSASYAYGPVKPPAEPAPTPAKVQGGVQRITVTIENGKYSPASISVLRGIVVRMTFKGGPKMGCGSTVVIKDFSIRQAVKEGESKEVNFRPMKMGVHTFTCPMNMYKGKITVK